MLSIAFCICLPEGNHQSLSLYVTVCHGRILQIRFWIVTKAITWSGAEKMEYKLRLWRPRNNRPSVLPGWFTKRIPVSDSYRIIMFHHGSSIFPILPCGKHGLLEAIHRLGNRGIFSRCNLRTGPDFPASQGACWGFVHRSWWGPVFGLVGFAACSWQSCYMLKTMGYDSNRMKISKEETCGFARPNHFMGMYWDKIDM